MFDPEQDIPGELWDFVDGINYKTDFCSVVKSMSRETFLNLFSAYLDARVELADALSNRGLLVTQSEDTVDDYCDSVVASGRHSYMEVFHGRAGNVIDAKPLLGLMESSFFNRYGVSPFDVLN